MLYNTRMNEVSYLHKYLEDYEKEIDALKQALESQFKQLSSEKNEVYDKLNRTREKKKSLQSRLDSKDNSSYFAAITPHQDNQSIEFKIENEHLRSLNEN